MDLETALAEIEKLKGENTTLTETNTKITKEKGELEKASKEKDVTIEDMKKHNAEKTDQLKKLRDLTAEEKAKLSAKEIEQMKRDEEFAEKQDQMAKEMADFKTSQRKSVVDKLVETHARGNKELADKIRFNLERLKDSELALDETTLAPLVEQSMNMLGSSTVDALRTAHNTGGQGGDGDKQGNSFADTKEGASLASALNLQSGKPAEGAK